MIWSQFFNILNQRIVSLISKYFQVNTSLLQADHQGLDYGLQFMQLEWAQTSQLSQETANFSVVFFITKHTHRSIALSVYLLFLEKAVATIKETAQPEQKIEYYSLDLTKGHEEVNKAFAEIEEKTGEIYMLVNCAGTAICGTIEDTKPEDARFLMDLNYYGTLYPIQYVLPKMKARKDGIIVLTGSQAGLLGIYGLGAYSATKFALRGLAETLTMETKHLGINVTLALPADTDTPGYANEEKSKPQETKDICGSGGLFKPEKVAKSILKDALKGNFFSILGFESWILSLLCCGMSPWKNPLLGLLQFYTMGPLRLIGMLIQWNFARIVKRSYKAKQKSK